MPLYIEYGLFEQRLAWCHDGAALDFAASAAWD